MNEVKENIESCFSNSTNVIRKTKRVPSLCEICGASALYKYFGVISCQSCKIFFKRNALLGMVCLFLFILFIFNFIII